MVDGVGATSLGVTMMTQLQQARKAQPAKPADDTIAKAERETDAIGKEIEKLEKSMTDFELKMKTRPMKPDDARRFHEKFQADLENVRRRANGMPDRLLNLLAQDTRKLGDVRGLMSKIVANDLPRLEQLKLRAAGCGQPSASPSPTPKK